MSTQPSAVSAAVLVPADVLARVRRRRALDRPIAAAPRCPRFNTPLHPYLASIPMAIHPCCLDEIGTLSGPRAVSSS